MVLRTRVYRINSLTLKLDNNTLNLYSSYTLN